MTRLKQHGMRLAPFASNKTIDFRNESNSGCIMPEKSIFKKIIDREIPADIVYEDDRCLAFKDVSPQAPTHVLFIPKKEIASVDDLADEDAALVGHLWIVIRNVARQLGVKSYRVVVNCGREAGQSVDHLHYHLLAGRAMKWPPG